MATCLTVVRAGSVEAPTGRDWTRRRGVMLAAYVLLCCCAGCGGASAKGVATPDDDGVSSTGLPVAAVAAHVEVPDALAAKAIALVEGKKVAYAVARPPEVPEEPKKKPKKGAKNQAPQEPPQPPPPEIRHATLKELLAGDFLAGALSMAHLTGGSWSVEAAGPAPSSGEDYQGQVYVTWRYDLGGEGIGPTWLVDPNSKRVEPHNRYAKVLHTADDLTKVAESRLLFARMVALVAGSGAWSEYEGISLASLTIKTIEENSRGEYDIIGWTVEDRPSWGWIVALHWRQGSAPHTAEWRLVDIEKNPFPQPANEEAAIISARAPAFAEWKPAQVLPTSYDLSPTTPRAQRWAKKARKGCTKHPEFCDALGLLLEQRDITTTLVWYLTDTAGSRRGFAKCTDEHKCGWQIGEAETPGRVGVFYNYVLAGEEDQIAFEVDLDKHQVFPGDVIAETIMRAARPRGLGQQAFGWYFDRWPTDPEMAYLFDAENAELREQTLAATWSASSRKAVLDPASSTEFNMAEGDGQESLGDEEVLGPIYAADFMSKIQRCIDSPGSPAEKRARYLVGFKIAASGAVQDVGTTTTGTTDQCLTGLFRGLEYRSFSGVPKHVRVPFEMH